MFYRTLLCWGLQGLMKLLAGGFGSSFCVIYTLPPVIGARSYYVLKIMLTPSSLSSSMLQSEVTSRLTSWSFIFFVGDLVIKEFFLLLSTTSSSGTDSDNMEDSGRTRSVPDLFGCSAASVPERFVNQQVYQDQGDKKDLPLFVQLPPIQPLPLQIPLILLHQILLNPCVGQIQHFLVVSRFQTFSSYHLSRSYYFLPCFDQAHLVLSQVFRYLFKFIFRSLFLLVMKD